jgi:hypothetical protein
MTRGGGATDKRGKASTGRGWDSQCLTHSHVCPLWPPLPGLGGALWWFFPLAWGGGLEGKAEGARAPNFQKQR